MKKFLSLLATGLVSAFLLATVAFADEIKTNHFTITLSDGWSQPKPAQKKNGMVTSILRYPDGRGAVSITVTPASVTARDLASQTLNNMKSGGFTVSEPKPSGDSYVGEFSQKQTRGISYFTTNGKLGSVITIIATDIGPGKAFLNKYFKAADPKLFPTSF